MKVLIGTAYFESHRGGIEIVAGRLARELRRSGDDVVWLATDANPAPAADAGCGTALAVPAWNITERRLGFPLPLPGPGSVMAIWKAVRAADALLLHDALYPTNVAAMIAARWERKPVVLVQHIAAVPYRSLALRGLMKAANRLIARPMLAAADQTVFISDVVRHHFRSVHFRSPPQVVFNGVDTEVFQPAPVDFDKSGTRARLGLPVTGDVVLFVGRFVEKKGLHIIERLARQRPRHTFALAGWGPIDPNSWGLANVRVISGLAGRSLAPLYQASDALLLPSIGEGLPLVMQEALACGLAVACGTETAAADPDLAALVESVEVDVADVERTTHSFGQALDRMLSSSALPAGEAARDRHDFVRCRYSWSDAARSYQAMMRHLTRTGPATAADSLARIP